MTTLTILTSSLNSRELTQAGGEVVCLFSLLGLMLSAAVLSYVSSETISVMYLSFG